MSGFFLTIESACVDNSATVPPTRQLFCVSELDGLAVVQEFYEGCGLPADSQLLESLRGRGLFIVVGSWKWHVVRLTASRLATRPLLTIFRFLKQIKGVSPDTPQLYRKAHANFHARLSGQR